MRLVSNRHSGSSANGSSSPFRESRTSSRDELLDLTGLTPGAVPPFGSLFGLETVCDPGLADNEQINFNAGSHRHSV